MHDGARFAHGAAARRTPPRPPRWRAGLGLVGLVGLLHLGVLQSLPARDPAPARARAAVRPLVWARQVPIASPAPAPAPITAPAMAPPSAAPPALPAPLPPPQADRQPAAPAAPATVAAPADPAADAATDLASVGPAPAASASAGSAEAGDGADDGDAAAPTVAPPVYATRLPPSTRLQYRLSRGALTGRAVLAWQPEGDRYDLQFDAHAGGRPLMQQRSQGRLESTGLVPERFSDRRRGRGSRAALFDHEAGRIRFTQPVPELSAWPGSQDRLGWVVQLAAILAAAPAPLPEVTLHVVGARGGAGLWTFHARGTAEVPTAAGPVQALHYERPPAVPRDQRVEAWLDPARGFWPVRLRFTPVLGGAPLDLLLEAEPPPR